MGIFITVWVLALILFLIGYSRTDENLKDSKKVSEIKNQIENEIKKLDVIKNVALLKIEDRSKMYSSIWFGARFITQSDKTEIWANFKNELTKNGWKIYPFKKEEFYEKSEFFCKENLKAELAIDKNTMWEKESTYFIIEIQYNSKNKDVKEKSLPEGCY